MNKEDKIALVVHTLDECNEIKHQLAALAAQAAALEGRRDPTAADVAALLTVRERQQAVNARAVAARERFETLLGVSFRAPGTRGRRTRAHAQPSSRAAP